MNNAKKRKAIKKRQAKQKASVIEELQKIPIRQISFERAGITRATYYRWRNDDAQFRKLTDEAIATGDELINDMSESQIIALIRERNLPAAKLWLQHHHPKYAPRLEITAQVKPPETLTPKQETLVKKALEFASMVGAEHYEEENEKK